MYSHFCVVGAVFEWDENKERLNFIKHGIKFGTAVKVFKDPNLLMRMDVEHGDELRYNALGNVGKILFVVCVMKSGNRIRLISARLATASEKKRYFEDEEY